MSILRRVCPDRFTSIVHQSHYTSIVDESRIEITTGPELRGPMTNLHDHDYRKCQFLEIRRQDSADKPIQVFNVHCPSSNQKRFKTQVRGDVIRWLKSKIVRGVIGGDLKFRCCRLGDPLQDTQRKWCARQLFALQHLV